jgi:hypothetical protein
MFVVVKYDDYGGEYRYYCRTIERARKIFEKVFWEWVESGELSLKDLECDSWEEFLSFSWEEEELEEVVYIHKIDWEEDKEDE